MDLEKELQTTCLLKYKLLFEEKKIVDSEFSHGVADLNAHLNEFRNKISKHDQSQIEQFDNTFFPKEKIEKIDVLDSDELTEKDVQVSPDKKSSEKPRWFKKLFREIAFMTHPDKIGNFPIQSIAKKYKGLYFIATKAYETDNYSDMLMIGNDLDLELPYGEIEKHITPSIDKLIESINTTKDMIGYQWHHVLEDQKELLLSNYLKQLGFSFTENEIKEVIRRKSNRKVGQRPVKNERKKLK